MLALDAAVVAHRYSAARYAGGFTVGPFVSFCARVRSIYPRTSVGVGPGLRFGVALLGLRLNLGDVATLGWNAILVVCAAMVTTVFFWGDVGQASRL